MPSEMAANACARLLDGLDALVGAGGARLDGAHGPAGLGLDLADQVGDRAGRRLGLLGELADLLGHDGEAAALLARARGLDRGVQGEQVGLLGDAGDGVDDAADPLRARAQLADRGRGVVGGGADGVHRLRGRARRPRCPPRRPSRAWAAARDRALGVAGAGAGGVRRPRRRSRARTRRARTCFSAPPATSPTARAISWTALPASSEVEASSPDALESVPAVCRDLADHRAQALGHGGEGAAEHVALGARRHVAREVAARDRLGGVGGLAQRLGHAAEGAGHAADLVLRARLHRDVEVALADPLGGLGHLAHRAAEAAGDEHERAADEQQRDQPDEDQLGAQRGDAGQDLVLRARRRRSSSRRSSPARGT